MEVESALLGKSRDERDNWVVRNPKKSLLGAVVIGLLVVVAVGVAVNKSNLSSTEVGAFNPDNSVADAVSPLLGNDADGDKKHPKLEDIVEEKNLKVPAGGKVVSDDLVGEEIDKSSLKGDGNQEEEGDEQDEEVDDPLLDEDEEGKFRAILGEKVEASEDEVPMKTTDVGGHVKAKSDVTRRRRCYTSRICLAFSGCRYIFRRKCVWRVYRRCLRLRSHTRCYLYRRRGCRRVRQRRCRRCARSRLTRRCFSCPSGTLIRKCEACLQQTYPTYFNRWARWWRYRRYRIQHWQSRNKQNSRWLYHRKCQRQCSFHCRA